MFLTFYVWIAVTGLVTTQKVCESGWFGKQCDLKCRCYGNQCLTTDQCSGCQSGWFGPSCQYADLAQVSQLPTTQPVLADNNDSTCLPANTNLMSVTVTWSTPYPFSWMRIRVQNPGLLKSFTVSFFTNSTPVTCTNLRNAAVTEQTLDIHCDHLGQITNVTLIGGGVSSLCSVYVSGGRNVALHQTTTQSSIYVEDAYPYGPEKAVDGNTNETFYGLSCTATTNSSNPSWSLRFLLPVIVNRYVLYNRIESQYRLRGFILTSFDANNSQLFTHTSTSLQDERIFEVISPDVSVSNVTIRLNGTLQLLTLCEVEIYGDTQCSSGQYGPYCDQRCNCANPSDPCFVSTGGCPSGCAAGYHGESCTQFCQSGKYGKDCISACSEFCVAVVNGIPVCASINGTCLNGCKDGYMLPQCDKICPAGTYGKNCISSCPHFCAADDNGTLLCDHINATCQKGCQDGYISSLCDHSCPAGTYGKDCKFNCSQFCIADINGTSVCDHVNGTCLKGCQDGYMFPTCNQNCSVGTFGKDCRSQCARSCLLNDKNIPECDHINGTCACQNGFQTPLCNEPCNAGKYGHQCNYFCSEFCFINNTSCSHIDGACHQGCQSGYSEPLCLLKIEDTSDDPPVGAIVGAVLGVLAAVVIISVIVVIVWRRKKAKPRQHNGNNINRSSFNLMNIGSMNSHSETELTTREKNHKDKESKSKEKGNIETSNDGAGAYYNVVSDVSRTTIQLKNLDMFLSTHNKSFYQEQFSKIPTNNDATTKVAERPENKMKNRYKYICAYDHSRVNLMTSNNHKQNDYINASHIQGYNRQESFIASQGPVKHTVEDFVRMVWEQNTDKIVMLTNLIEKGKKKCERYWPEDGEMKVGQITVQLTTTQVFADYTIRRLKLRKQGQSDHLVTHFHFTAWPDKDVPLAPWSLVDFEQRVASYPTSKPIVVHCSAGVGPTGTFIALRNAMKQTEDKGYLDIFSTVQKLRHDRINMVQTSTQYEFLHRAAQVAILCMGTTVSSNDIQQRISYLDKTAHTGLTNMEREFKIICDVKSDEEDDKENIESAEDPSNVYENSQNVNNRHKNRLNNITPKMMYAPVLQCETDYLGDYINAVFAPVKEYINVVYVPSFRKQNQQFLTQLPLPTTVIDFWRLVTQYNVSLIVAFEDDLKATDQTIGEYLPSSDNQAVTFSMFELETKTISKNKLWQQRKVTVTADTEYMNTKLSTSAAEEPVLIHLKCLTTDLHPENMLTLITEIRSLNPGSDGRTIYMCRNGASYSGLVCVLSLLLDRMDNDGSCTVPLVVGAIKAVRPQVIPTLAQYQLLYQVLKLYSDSSNVYANLNQ